MSETIKVTLGDYKALPVSKNLTVEEQEIQKEFKRAQETAARKERKYGTAEMGDEVLIDFIGLMDGIPFPGGAGNDFPLVLGSGTFIPGFEEQLVGAGMGDQVDVILPFPENYQAADLAGKDAVFKVTVKDVRRSVLPEIDDAMIRSVSNCSSVEDFRSFVSEKILADKKEALKDQLLEDLLAICEVEIPEENLQKTASELKQNFIMQLQYAGQSLEQYLMQEQTSMEKFNESAEAQAEVMIKTQSILNEIAAAEGIEISRDELNTQLADLAMSYHLPIDELVDKIGGRGIEVVKNDAIAEKTLEMLLSM